MTEPLWFRWNGSAMMPMRPDAAAHQFVVDQRYLLEAHYERSYQRHKAYFAALHNAWHNLATDDFPTSEHLRKFALIKTGWHNERMIVCHNEAEAERMAAFVRPIDSYAIVRANRQLLSIWTAKSQSFRAMGREDFNRSMEDVLTYCAGLIGVTRDELLSQGEMA